MASLGQVRERRREGGALRLFALLFVLSLALLVARNTPIVRGASEGLTGALVPFERALAQGGSVAAGFGEAVSEIQRLRGDNAQLRAEVERLTLENVRLREAAIAAQQAALLNAVAQGLPYETIRVPVIARDPSGVLHSVMLGAGRDAGIEAGQVVVSERGVVGRVSEVGETFSKVRLVTDASSLVSATLQGSRATGIVRGQYGDALVMDWILQTEQVGIGDVVLTAGLALGDDLRSLYPKGLVLGTVVAVESGDSAAYRRAIVLPAVDLRRLEQVLVLKTP